jgi:hypothetical protein
MFLNGELLIILINSRLKSNYIFIIIIICLQLLVYKKKRLYKLYYIKGENF